MTVPGARRIGGWLRSFGAFWWDFIVGDDWLVAAGIIVGLAVTGLLVGIGVPAWWILPVAVLATLPISLLRGVRDSHRT